MNIEMPVTLKMGDLMSEEEFFQFCQMNDTLEFERDSHGNIILMSPTGGFTGGFNFRVSGQFFVWNDEKELGEGFDSSTGFTLSNGAVRSPDVSWISYDRWDKLSRGQRKKFIPICPDFVIEIRSESDDLKYLLDKMNEYLANGVKLAWLLDAINEKAYVFEPGKPVVIYDNFDITLSGEPLLPGFILKPGAIVKKLDR